MDRTRRAVRIAVTPSSVLNYLISDQEQRQFVCQDLWVIAFPRVLTTWDFWPWKSTRQELFFAHECRNGKVQRAAASLSQPVRSVC